MSDLQVLESSGTTVAASGHEKRRSSTRAQKSQSSKDWTIKGLPVEAVEVARDAARESGMKINAWVANVFELAAQDKLPVSLHSKEVNDVNHLNNDCEIKRLRESNEQLQQTINNLSAAIAKLCQ